MSPVLGAYSHAADAIVAADRKQAAAKLRGVIVGVEHDAYKAPHSYLVVEFDYTKEPVVPVGQYRVSGVRIVYLATDPPAAAA